MQLVGHNSMLGLSIKLVCHKGHFIDIMLLTETSKLVDPAE